MTKVNHKSLIILFCVALLVRVLFFLIFAIHEGTPNFVLPGGDSYHYLAIGKNLASGHGYSQALEPPYVPNSDRSPFLPFLLAAVTGFLKFPIAVHLGLQILIGSLSVIVLYWLGKRIFTEQIAMAAALFYALDPFVSWSSILLLTETWFTFFLLLSLWTLIRFWQEGAIRSALWSGAILGLATLTRAVSVFYSLIVIVAIGFLRRQSWQTRLLGALSFVVIFGLVLSPWVIRNYKTFGVASLSSVPAYNWYWYNAREFYTLKHHLSESQGKTVFLQWREEALNDNPALNNELRLQSFYLRKAFSVIREDFPGYLRFHMINTLAVYLNSGWDNLRYLWDKGGSDTNFTALLASGWPGVVEVLKNYPGAVLEKLFLGLFYLLIVGGWFRSWITRREFGFFSFLLITVLFFGLAAGAVAEPRFRVVVEPLLWLLFVVSLSLVFPRAWSSVIDKVRPFSQKV